MRIKSSLAPAVMAWAQGVSRRDRRVVTLASGWEPPSPSATCAARPEALRVRFGRKGYGLHRPHGLKPCAMASSRVPEKGCLFLSLICLTDKQPGRWNFPVLVLRM